MEAIEKKGGVSIRKLKSQNILERMRYCNDGKKVAGWIWKYWEGVRRALIPAGSSQCYIIYSINNHETARTQPPDLQHARMPATQLPPVPPHRGVGGARNRVQPGQHQEAHPQAGLACAAQDGAGDRGEGLPGAPVRRAGERGVPEEVAPDHLGCKN